MLNLQRNKLATRCETKSPNNPQPPKWEEHDR